MEIEIDAILNLPHTRVTGFTFTDREVFIHLKRVTKTEICPNCGSVCGTVRRYLSREVRDLDLLGRKTMLTIESRQFECLDCNRFFVEDLGFVEGNHGLTKRYEAYLYFLSKEITIRQVCLKADVCWPTVNAIHVRYANREIHSRMRKWANVRVLGIDEISIRKGRKNYACVLMDAERGIVIDFLEKRDMATLVAYFTGKGAELCQQIEVVVSDMWDGFVNLVGSKGIFINAINVIDRFHFVQHLSKALDKCRQAHGKAFSKNPLMKNLRWTLLKSPENLTKEDRIQLAAAFKISPSLSAVYNLRTSLKDIFDTECTKEEGLKMLDNWEAEAKKLLEKSLRPFLNTMSNWKDKVANFFIDRVTNAGTEGMNNHIRGIIRRAYGYLSFAPLRLRVLTECSG